MISASFWSLPMVDSVVTPLKIMKEQAGYLFEESGGALRGTATSSGNQEMIINTFSIVVPALGNYVYQLARYQQRPTAIYPGHLTSMIHGKTTLIESLEQFTNEFASILRSTEARELLTSLLAQAAEAG